MVVDLADEKDVLTVTNNAVATRRSAMNATENILRVNDLVVNKILRMCRKAMVEQHLQIMVVLPILQKSVAAFAWIGSLL